jgi:ubiquinone/menaquinone biosynthesis C-methylase UbiE
MTVNDLSEFSSSYYENSNIYKIFSDSEDKEHIIWNYIKPLVTQKTVLDLGCGNGRYLQKINEVSSSCVGVDQSIEQICQSDYKLPFVCTNAAHLPFNDNSFDVIVSCWVLGTILNLEKRNLVMNEAKRVLKKDGIFLMIENDTPSEFEFYRGRHLNNKTQEYNDWILSNNFSELKKLETFITFKNTSEAQFIFAKIWQNKLFSLPKNHKIQNNVIIFQFKK